MALMLERQKYCGLDNCDNDYVALFAAMCTLHQLDCADVIWLDCLPKLEKYFGIIHDRYGRALLHYAEHLQRCGKTEAALENITQAVKILTQALGDEHPDTKRAKETAAVIAAEKTV